ncbi:MAG: serine/threonine protein kinase [Planctomycetota bacterium]|nr:MAG: serine/threonine protein kinase [Planctomycetota bacterium]
MKTIVLNAIVVLSTISPLCAGEWDRFRGPNGSGIMDGQAPPWQWSSEKNLKWKAPLPGKGSSSPIVSGDRIFVTCYTGYGLDLKRPGNPEDLVRHLIALDRSTGQEVWRASIASSAEEDPYKGFITQHGYASSTPVTDGSNVFVLLGKSGLFAFDREGKQLWHTELGTESDPAKWGDGSSPIIFGDLVIVDAGVLGNRFVGVEKSTGQIAWSVEDPSFTNCWATPTPVRVGGSDQILFHVPKKVMAVDPTTGSMIWTAASPLDDAACGSIVTKDGNAYLMGSRAGHALAIKCGGEGDVSSTNKLWQTRVQAGISTPVIVGDNLYWANGGIFFAARLSTGEYVYKQRLPRLGGPTGGFPNADYSSPIVVGGNIILFTRNGESYVVKPGDEFQLVAHNPAFEGDASAFSATPAASDGELFVRSESNVYCIGKPSK